MNKTAKDLWRPKHRIEALYLKYLRSASKELMKRIDKISNPRDILKAIKKFTMSKEFNDYADASAMKIVTHLFTDAGHTWRQAAQENSKGKEIYQALQKEMKGPIGASINEQIQRNAAIIKTLPLDISNQITHHIMSENMKGKRASDIADEIRTMFPHTSKAKATLIARTETSKTSTALTKIRSKQLGFKWYIWETSIDGRVRSSHAHMQDVLISFNDPPSPEKLIGAKFVGYYDAGNIYNCRCYPSPVIDINYINFPHKVYYNGQIVTMNKTQFKEIM